MFAGASIIDAAAQANLCFYNYLQANKIQLNIFILGSSAGDVKVGTQMA
jgi:hypothetical protein